MLPLRSLRTLLFLAATTGSLAACGTTKIDLPARTPTDIGSRVAIVENRNNAPWCGLNRRGLGSPVTQPNEGEFIAGFNNFYDPGTDPIPCDHQISLIYAGVVRFDLSDIQNKIIVSAILRLDRRDTNVPVRTERRLPSGGVEDLHQCFTLIEISTEFATGHAEGLSSNPNMTIDSVPIRGTVEMDNGTGIVGTSRDVTAAVQEWALGRRPNNGFAFKPRPADVAKNNNSCTGYYFNPRLEVTILDRPPEST